MIGGTAAGDAGCRRCCGLLIPPRVGPAIVDVQTDGHESASALGGQHGDLGGNKLRGIFGLERLRADDVTHGKSARDQGHGEDPFGLTGHVGGDPLVDDDQGSNNEIDEVDTCD